MTELFGRVVTLTPALHHLGPPKLPLDDLFYLPLPPNACPACNSVDTLIRNTHAVPYRYVSRRIRCNSCQHRWTVYELIDTPTNTTKSIGTRGPRSCSIETIRDILTSYIFRGESQSDIATRIGLNRVSVHKICLGQTYNDVLLEYPRVRSSKTDALFNTSRVFYYQPPQGSSCRACALYDHRRDRCGPEYPIYFELGRRASTRCENFEATPDPHETKDAPEAA